MLLGLISHYFFGLTIFFTSLFLVLLVLVQRGRGGGIAGALGGAGGQSAFGTKAGDLFTRITVGVAAVWILLCCGAIYFLKTPEFTTGVKKKDTTSLKSDSTGKTSGTTTDVGLGGLGAVGSNTGLADSGTTPTEASKSGTTASNAVPEVTAIPGATAPTPTTTPPANSTPATEPGSTPTAEPGSTPVSEPGSTPAKEPTPATEPPATEPAPGNPPTGDTPPPSTPNN
jgi:preprotein translocase subunit SecG